MLVVSRCPGPLVQSLPMSVQNMFNVLAWLLVPACDLCLVRGRRISKLSSAIFFLLITAAAQHEPIITWKRWICALNCVHDSFFAAAAEHANKKTCSVNTTAKGAGTINPVQSCMPKHHVDSNYSAETRACACRSG